MLRILDRQQRAVVGQAQVLGQICRQVARLVADPDQAIQRGGAELQVVPLTQGAKAGGLAVLLRAPARLSAILDAC